VQLHFKMEMPPTPYNNSPYEEILKSVGLRKEHLVYPIFVDERESSIPDRNSMSGIMKISRRKIKRYIQAIINLGIQSIIVYGIPVRRDRNGSLAAYKDGLVQGAIRDIKKEFGDLLTIISDVCVCQYNLSGHCGLVIDGSEVDNDSTLKVLAAIALSHAEAGTDVVAPSAMMDGQVISIRNALNIEGFHKVKILSYSVKTSSSLYSPFRSVTFCKGIYNNIKIDKSSYQIAYANSNQILREIESDILEGADMVMIKPGIANLDLVTKIKEKLSFPLAVQNVSGEYAMVKAAAMHGWINEEGWKVASIAALRRAGADKIISYFGLDIMQYIGD